MRFICSTRVLTFRRHGSQMKKTKKSKGKNDSQSNMDMMLKALRGVPPPEFQLTEEEKALNYEIGKEYNRRTTIRHNHLMRSLQTQIDLKNKAIEALPKELQAEALEEDLELIPLERIIPTWTPPIPGYAEYIEQLNTE